MLELLGLFFTAGAAGVGYVKSRSFVADRLRFVDAAQSPIAPLVAGAAAAVVAAPVVWLLPVVGTGTALLFGAAVGIGTRAGARAARHAV
jgi:hypothetical protein